MNSLISYISASKTRLYIASLSKTNLPQCTHALLKLFLFSGNEDHHFFAYTQTRDEVSMVLTESSLKLFPDNVLKVTASPWRALSVSLGSSGYTGTGIISTLSNILSQAKINIFYLSTANTDFILVQEEKLEKAIQSLRENFDILTEGEESLLLVEEEKSSFDITSLKQNLVTVSSADAVVFDPSKSAGLTLYLLPDVMYLCSLAKDNRQLVAQALLQHVFYPETSVGFFTFVETEDEISLLISKEHIKNFPEDAFTVSDIWRPIQRFRKSNFSEIGVISALSAPIARAKIPILYISTFTSAYMMVQYKNVSASTMCLESQKYHVEQLKMNDAPPVL
jgi:hypothetical protein